jgi:hypothetical protein
MDGDGELPNQRVKAKKNVIIKNYSWGMGYINKGERTINSCSISKHGCGQKIICSLLGPNCVE